MVKDHQVIVVTINYRLGPLGWFTHPDIQGNQEDIDKTSNFGTLDIIHALKWVNKNISNFGGDKNNVTIFGESAGGHNVLSLLVSPLAKGLFHKAISQSGYTTSISAQKAYKQSEYSDTSANTSSERMSMGSTRMPSVNSRLAPTPANGLPVSSPERAKKKRNRARR